MSKNEDIVKSNYKDALNLEELRATASRYSGLELLYTQKHISPYIKADSKVIELGCGTGYYAICFSRKCKDYIGVDITPENIDLLNKKVLEQGIENVVGKVGDATSLKDIPDDFYNVILCLGPLYHLPPDERELVFAECRRICKKNGIAAFAYINKVGVYAGACLNDNLRENYPNEKANELVLKCCTDDLKPDLFFFTMPEEIEAIAQKYGFIKIKNLGTDFSITASIIESMNDEKFEIIRPLLDEMASYESCTGMSSHALLICKKSE